MNKENDTEKGLRELFRHAFLANCHLDNFIVTDMEHEALVSISTADVLEGFKELILALLKYKKQSGESWTAAKKKISILENEVSNFSKIERDLKEEIEYLKLKLKESDEKLSELKRPSKLPVKFTEEPSFSGHKRHCSLNITGQNFDCEGFVSSLNESFSEIEKPLKPSSGILTLKEKLKEKSDEISKIQDKIRSKIYQKDSRNPSQIPRLLTPTDSTKLRNQENSYETPITRLAAPYTRGSSESKFTHSNTRPLHPKY